VIAGPERGGAEALLQPAKAAAWLPHSKAARWAARTSGRSGARPRVGVGFDGAVVFVEGGLEEDNGVEVRGGSLSCRNGWGLEFPPDEVVVWLGVRMNCGPCKTGGFYVCKGGLVFGLQ
jgi:hypothetical protein